MSMVMTGAQVRFWSSSAKPIKLLLDEYLKAREIGTGFLSDGAHKQHYLHLKRFFVLFCEEINFDEKSPADPVASFKAYVIASKVIKQVFEETFPLEELKERLTKIVEFYFSLQKPRKLTSKSGELKKAECLRLFLLKLIEEGDNSIFEERAGCCDDD